MRTHRPASSSRRRQITTLAMMGVFIALPVPSSAQPSSTLPAIELEVTLPMPSEVSPDRVVLWSSGTMSVDHDVIVAGNGTSTLVSMPSTPPSTSASLRVGAKSEAENIHSAFRVVLDRSRISGDVRSARTITLLGTAQVLGARLPDLTLSTVSGPTLPVAFPAGTFSAVTLASKATQILAPGRYTNVDLGPNSTLHLTAGSYYVESLKSASDARLIVDDTAGPVKLYVRRSVELRGPQHVTSGSAQTFLLVALEKPVIVDRGFMGALVAPNVAVQLGNQPGSVFTGSFFGRTMTVREHSRVNHVPSPLVWRPRIPFGTSEDSTRTCDAAFLTLDPSETDVIYVANPSCPPAFCDADDQPIASPSEAVLNDPTVTPVTCLASLGHGTECPIDPLTVTDNTACETSADCDDGKQCGERCTDVLCTGVELRCGHLAASCGGLPSGGLCDPREWRECGDPLDRGTVSVAAVQGQLFLQADPLPGAYASPAEKATPHPTYPAINSISACDILQASPFPLATGEAGTRDATQGNSEWGIAFKPTFEHFADLTHRDLGDGVIRVGAEVGLDVLATVRGTAVRPIHTLASVLATRCGVRTSLEATLFDDLVDIPELLDAAHGLTHNPGDATSVVATPANAATTCETRSTERQTKARAAKGALVIARQVQKFVDQFGTTQDLCQKTEIELPGVDLGPCNNPAIQSSLAVVDEWRDVFNDAVDQLAAADAAYSQSQAAVLIDDKIELADEGDEFDKVIVHASIGIGPLSLTVQLKAVGSYNLSGDLQYRLALDGPVPTGTDGIVPTAPSLGDLRASAGAVMSAHLDVSLVAFVGAGIPDYASAGLEGTLELVDGTVDFNSIGSIMMVSEPDSRVISTSEWAGDVIPNLTVKTNTNFRWVSGWRYQVDTLLSMLNGAIDLVARVGVDPFELSFRENLTSWTGPVQLQSTLVDADPLEAKDNFGATNEQIPLTRVPPSTPISPDPGDFNVLYAGSLFDARDGESVAIGCGGPN